MMNPKVKARWAISCLVLPMQVMHANAWMVGKVIVSSGDHMITPKSTNFPSLPLHLNFCGNNSHDIRRGPPSRFSTQLHESSSSSTEANNDNCNVKMSELNDMDVVIFSLLNDDKLCLGAIQEDGILSPLSAWTDEPAYGDSVEFLVDEVDRFSLAEQSKDQWQIDAGNDSKKNPIRIHHLLSEDEVSYGQRQCPRGVHNPHGEESEITYYINQQLIEQFEISVDLKPELEILW